MKKRLKFREGCNRIDIPFMLHDLNPWQDQIRDELEKVQDRYVITKRMYIGYEINDQIAMIKIFKYL